MNSMVILFGALVIAGAINDNYVDELTQNRGFQVLSACIILVDVIVSW